MTRAQDRAGSRPSSCRRAGCSSGSRATTARSAGAKPSLEGWAEAVDGAFEAFRDRFIGADPFAIEDIWQVGYRGGFYRGGRGADVARSPGSSRRCGTSRAGRSGCPPGRCSAARCATRSAPTPGSAATGRTRSPRPPSRAQGAGLHRGQDERDRRARLDRHAQAVRRRREARRGGAGAGHGRRARLPRPRPPAAGQAAGEGAGAARPAVHRGAAAVGEHGRAARDRGA